MQPKAPKLLEDVRDAAAFIGEAVRGKGLVVWSTIDEEVPVLLAEVEALLRTAP
jgi:hypothetical protein